MTTYTHKVRAFESERGTITVSVHDSSAIAAMIVPYPEEEAAEEVDTSEASNAIIDIRLRTHGLI